MNNINAIKFISEGTSIISLAKTGSSPSVSLEYSYDDIDWSEWNLSGLTINSGDTLFIRGYNPKGFSSSSIDYYKFVIEGDKVSCSGNIMSLIDYKTLPDIIPCDYCFYVLFSDCTALTTAPELPATELTNRCYSWMFERCTSLKTAPELPATALADWCYSFMFYGCTALTTAPELPAMTLAESCYESMFYNCAALTTAPELPATKLVDFCYAFMFSGCTSLTSAQELPTNISNNSKLYYMYMVNDCKFMIALS